MKVRLSCIALLTLASLAGACATDETPGSVDAPSRVEVAIAPLDLPGIVDACYDLEVRNFSGETVFTKRISSQQFGNGQGDASYVGPCDADNNEVDAVVFLDVVGIYNGIATTCGDVFDPADNFDSASQPFNDSFGILQREVTCQANADVPVNFDVTILRPANQGFFDIAVEFDNIFCSAKFDCCEDADESGACDPTEYINLLHNGDARDTTVILGFACTAGTGNADTTLLMNDIVIDCGVGGTATIDPTGPTGNMYGTAFVDDANGFLFQVGNYQGEENLGFNKRYWNIAIGLDTVNLDGETCALYTAATADDANTAGGASEQHIADGTVYPYIDFNISLWDAATGMACTAAPLNEFEDSPVYTYYTLPDEGADFCFDHSYPEVAQGGVCGGGGLPPLNPVAMTLFCMQNLNNEDQELQIGYSVDDGGENISAANYTVVVDASTDQIIAHIDDIAGASGGVIFGSADTEFPPDLTWCNPSNVNFNFGGTGSYYVAVIDHSGATAALCDPGTSNISNHSVIGISPAVEAPINQCVM